MLFESPLRSLDDVSDALWQAAATREFYIRPLAVQRHTSIEDVDRTATALSVSRSYVYRLLSAYRKRPQTSTLLLERRGPRSSMRPLGDSTEALISEAIRDVYLTSERPRLSDLMREIRSQCHEKQLRTPDKRTVRHRIAAMDQKKVTAARLGGKRARERFHPALVQSRPEYPLNFVEIDHSPVDVIAVDEENRLPIGRPWLTLAVDIPTRMVLGFYLSFEAPSALSVALVLTHSVLGKGSWLAERDLSLSWPASGIPDWIETDNGEEFHSKAFERGTTEYGIRLTYRPPGSPEVGGHIERLIGTFMHRIHLIPGTTFSNVGQKGDYDSEAHAVMTLREIERWLALEILGQYHKDEHSVLHEPPEVCWQRQIQARPLPIRQALEPERFLLDFLPGEKRLIRRDGIRIFNIHYWDNILSPLAGRSKKPFLVKYDPRDLSRVFLQDEAGQYWPIPYRDLGAPPITLWEHRTALHRLREQGRQSVDENTMFRTVAEQRALITEAKTKTRSQRLAAARVRTALALAKPQTARDGVEIPANCTPAPFAVEEW